MVNNISAILRESNRYLLSRQDFFLNSIEKKDALKPYKVLPKSDYGVLWVLSYVVLDAHGDSEKNQGAGLPFIFVRVMAMQIHPYLTKRVEAS